MSDELDNTPITPEYKKLLQRIERHLQQPTEDSPWIKDVRYVNCNRRPMKNYNLIFLTGIELGHIIELYTQSLPEKYWRTCFLRAQAYLLSYPEHKRIAANVFGWLIGWILQETLDTAIKSNILSKSKNSGGKNF